MASESAPPPAPRSVMLARAHLPASSSNLIATRKGREVSTTDAPGP